MESATTGALRSDPALTPKRTTAPLLTPAETSAILGVTTETLAVWRCTKRYPTLNYIKVGRSVRYRAEAVEEFINSRTV